MKFRPLPEVAQVHPYAMEQLLDAKVTGLIEEAEVARLARVARWPRRHRGLGIAKRITRRADRRRLRDLAY